MPTNFVLVHGAWHGGWCWRRVVPLLEEHGHRVFTPTLTGLGERAHLLDGTIRLATHIADVVNVIRYEDLDDVVLVGHSYGGLVISGVAEQLEKSIRALVFVDAFVPQNGEAMVDLTRKEVADGIRAAAARGEIAVPPISAARFQVNEKDRAWVDAMCRPHPIATLVDKIALSGARERIARKAYVRGKNYGNPAFDRAYEQLKNNPKWATFAVDCGHDIMVDKPEELAGIFLQMT